MARKGHTAAQTPQPLQHSRSISAIFRSFPAVALFVFSFSSLSRSSIAASGQCSIQLPQPMHFETSTSGFMYFQSPVLGEFFLSCFIIAPFSIMIFIFLLVIPMKMGIQYPQDLLLNKISFILCFINFFL